MRVLLYINILVWLSKVRVGTTFLVNSFSAILEYSRHLHNEMITTEKCFW